MSALTAAGDPTMDAISELLRAVRLTAALFFHAECVAPWCISSPSSSAFQPYVANPGSHIIEFHHIAEGRGYVRVGGETTPLQAGDVVMLTQGDPHVMGNGEGAHVIDGSTNLDEVMRGVVTVDRIGDGSGEATRLICGYLACDSSLMRPVIASLPRVLRVPLHGDADGESLQAMIRHAVRQARDRAPGSDIVVGRLAEVLFTEALRRYLVQLPPDRTGWLACASDRAVGRALAALHRQPAHAWTLDELAAIAGLSRSSLTERFSRYLGHGPMGYLAEWRLELAAQALRASSRSVIGIAGDVGYESEAAFSRAFKRRFGSPPARYRRESAATA